MTCSKKTTNFLKKYIDLTFLKMANFCTNCGISLPNDIKFCTDCGNKIGQEIPIEDKSKEIKEVENRSEISQDVNEIANNEGEIAENKGQIRPTKSIENTSTGIDPKYIIIGIVALLIIGAVYTMRTSTSSSDNSNPGDIIKQPIQKSQQPKKEQTSSNLKKVEFYNKLNKKVFLAVAYWDVTEKWRSTGYFAIGSKESYIHSYKSTSNLVYYFADGAESTSDKPWWEGNLEFCIDKKNAFNILKSDSRKDLCGKNEVLKNFLKVELTGAKNTVVRILK